MGGGRATAGDYLTMGEVGEWELTPVGEYIVGVGGGLAGEGGDHLLQSQATGTRGSRQPSPKMLMAYR